MTGTTATRHPGASLDFRTRTGDSGATMIASRSDAHAAHRAVPAVVRRHRVRAWFVEGSAF